MGSPSFIAGDAMRVGFRVIVLAFLRIALRRGKRR
jgi:hypothetical protein